MPIGQTTGVIGQGTAPDLDLLSEAESERSVPKHAGARALATSSAKPISFSRRWWVGLTLLLSDVVALQLALAGGFLIRAGLSPVWPISLQMDIHYTPLALWVLVFPVGFWFAGLYPGYGKSMVERLRRRVYTIVLVFATLLAWNFTTQDSAWSRGGLILTMGLALLTSPLMESLLRTLLIRLRCWGVPAIVFGANDLGAYVLQSLHKHRELGVVPVAVLDDRPEMWRQSLEGVPVVGSTRQARRLAGCAEVAIIALPDLRGQRVTRLAERLPFHRIIVVPDLIGVARLWVAGRDLGGLMGLEVQKNLIQRHNWLFKRAVDCVFSALFLLLSLPLLALMMLWIKVVDPGGPVLFSQERVGLGGRSVRIWKLRSMYCDAETRLSEHLARCPEAREEWARYVKLREDPRILPYVGRFLRKTSLDEVPQFWNILCGEMSLVGPRPLPRYHLDHFPASFRSLRRRVRPGLTGLWQVNARSNGDLRVQQMLDMYYVRNWSMWLDIYLLMRTVRVVLGCRGAY